MRISIFFTALLLLSQNAFAGGYCLALRGNGELAPAHWGAMAGLVEKLGLPERQAGGSSATVTMMLNDAVATNPFVVNATESDRRAIAALLIKSFEGFVSYLTETKEWRDFLLLVEWGGDLRRADWLDELQTLLAGDTRSLQRLDLLRSNFINGVRFGFISETSYAPLYLALSSLLNPGAPTDEHALNLRRATFYAAELQKTLTVFGRFDAKNDAGLFFRPGLVDFAKLGEQLGRIADFYAAQKLDRLGQSAWDGFIKSCKVLARDLTWAELSAAHPQCQSQLNQLIGSQLASSPHQSFSHKPAGVSILSYPTTAVLTGSAYQEAERALKEYASALNPEFGLDFRLSNPEELRFGYWGGASDLGKMTANLSDEDEKSRRFLALGPATWGEVLRLSPAEPGLASLQYFESDGQPMISAGGWSDLHPVAVLKAVGCEQVIYVTRRGGESFFAQGVAKRLLGLDRAWSLLDSEKAALVNNNGDIRDQSSLWSRLFNLANPRSSFRQSLDGADAVLCTDWNRFNVRAGIGEMIHDAYRSPYFVRSRQSPLALSLRPQLHAGDTHPNGFPTYAGCF